MSTLLKNKILKELDNVQWSQDSAQENSDLSFEAIINGIFDYINSDYTIVGNSTGLITPPVPPSPLSFPTTHDLLVTSTSWLNTFKTTVRTGIATGGIQRMFLGIQTMLLGTVQIRFTAIPSPLVSIVPPINTPAMVVLFPSIASFGSSCAIEINGKKPNNINDVWTIISKYIQQALNINIISPIPTAGATVGASYTGVTATVLSFS